MPRITLKKVAAEARISISCTARALKGRPGISSATRLRVREIAERLGYRPDPMLSALATYREARKRKAFQGCVAYLANHDTESECLASLQSGDPLLGARKRAALLGYQLRYFKLHELMDSPERFWKRLQNQGIHGVLLRSFPFDSKVLPQPPDGFPCIDLFSQPHTSTLPTVSSNHAQSMELTLHQLLSNGCKRPALVLNRGISTILHHAWHMTFKSSEGSFQKSLVFHHDDFPLKISLLEKWIRRECPDALLFCFSEDWIPEKKILSKWHRRGISVISMDLLDPVCGIAGIYQDRKTAGAEAFSLLHGMIITSGIGVPRIPTATLIPGTWKERGKSLEFPNRMSPFENKDRHHMLHKLGRNAAH